MADAKITQLTELTDPALVDLFAIVDDPSGSPSTKKVSLDTLSAIFNKHSMSRQAIINGNFDVWQRGTSTTIADSTIVFLADRWRTVSLKDGGTAPTITVSKQTLTAGDIPNAYFYQRLNTNGAGTSLGAGSYHQITQKIEYGTRYLCGNGKKVTISFWARSDIANKKIGLSLSQNYGTGGSPTTAENIITMAPITLTSTWTKYTATFTTNTLAGKTFGTGDNDYLAVTFYLMWGSTFADTYVYSGAGAETYVGSGNTDIAQVQLCAGDVALPFMPKSYNQELLDCMRYYQYYGNATLTGDYLSGSNQTTTAAYFPFILPVRMRTIPVLEKSTVSGTNFQVISNNGAYNISNLALNTGVDNLHGDLTATMATATAGSGCMLRVANGNYFAYLAEP